MKNILILLLLICYNSIAQVNADLLIKNGKIIDGSGNSWFIGDLAIKDGKIFKVGKNLSMGASKAIDAKGLVVAPGFIDVHGHIEGGVLTHPFAGNYLYDGVTTVVTGNCGGSETNLPEYFRKVDSAKPAINLATLVGHNSVRAAVMGRDNKQPTEQDQKDMEALVEKCMKDGAVGLSTGLIYVPGTYAKTEEVIGLAKAAARFNGVYASHIRNEESDVTTAVEEAINIGRQANIPVQISHFKVGGKANWGRSKETIAQVEAARKQGLDVTIDQYPYTASSTNLGVRLPNWSIAGTQDSISARINDPILHQKIKAGMLAEIHRYKFKNYSFAYVANYGADSTYNGKSISEINRMLGRKANAKDEAETIMDMMKKGGAQMVYHTMNEEDVKYILQYPFNMVGADAGIPLPGKGMPHPRGYGSNARILGKYVREEKVIRLEEAIRRMSSLAAQKFMLKDRGLLKEGFAADVVIFNESEIGDRASFENPHQYSVGMKYIIVNGRIEIEEGKDTGLRSGKILMGPAYPNNVN